MRPVSALLSLCALALLATVEPAPAVAADPSAEGTVMTDKARQLYEEGVAASKKNQLAEARVSFLAAFSLNKHWQIAGNLADCEIQLGKFRDGAEHAAYYLKNAPPDRRERAEGLLKQAKAKIGTLRVAVDQVGAEVLVDDVSIGRSPLAEAVFVDPGKRKIAARFAGRDDVVQSVDVTAGSAKEVSLKMIPVAVPPPGTGTATVPPPPPPRSMVPGLVMAGAGVAALGTGIALLVVGGGKGSDAERGNATILAAGHSCVPGAANFDSSCDALSSTAKSGSTMHNAGVGLVAGAGALGVGAAVYLLWPASKPDAQGLRSTRVTPLASQSGGGLVWSGSF